MTLFFSINQPPAHYSTTMAPQTPGAHRIIKPKHLTPPKRDRITRRRLSGESYGKIAEDEKTPKTTVRRIYKDFIVRNSHNRKPGSGRPKKLSRRPRTSDSKTWIYGLTLRQPTYAQVIKALNLPFKRKTIYEICQGYGITK